MNESESVAQDLRFVKQAVEARDRPRPPFKASLLIWAGYTLICVPTYDFIPRYGGRINLVGWLAAAVMSWVLGKRETKRTGQFDRQELTRTILHWYGGIALMLVALVGLACFNPAMRGSGPLGIGQLSIVLVGFLYYTAGVHTRDLGFMRWAGPVIVIAAVLLPLVPHYPWTVMGVIFTVCLLIPVVFGRDAETPGIVSPA